MEKVKFKILNLYAGIGGNRKLWDKPLKEKFCNDYQITAIEYNEEIAAIYKDFFPNDEVIVTDAHQYLLEHFKEFDFIWSSPPCPTHSSIRYLMTGKGQHDPIYPEMSLYQEIIFLKHHFNGKYVVENVKPYYQLLIKESIKIDRHLFWNNYYINKIDIKKEENIRFVKPTSKRYGFDLSDKKINHRKDTIIRNLLNPEIGLHFLNRALEIKESENVTQKTLFD